MPTVRSEGYLISTTFASNQPGGVLCNPNMVDFVATAFQAVSGDISGSLPSYTVLTVGGQTAAQISTTVTTVASGLVSSFATRTGAVVPAANDYSFSLISGTATIAQGGTGQTTASGAINAILPTQTGQSSKFLSSNGAICAWSAVPTYSADGTTLTLTGSVFSINATYGGQSSISVVGNITSGQWGASTISIAHGGTGGTTASVAINNLLPTQTGLSGTVLGTNGTAAGWISYSSGISYSAGSGISISPSNVIITVPTSTLLASDPLLVPIPAGVEGQNGTYPRTSGVLPQLIPYLYDNSMALPSYSQTSTTLVGLWRPQDGNYTVTPPTANLAYWYNADDVDANYSYNNLYPVIPSTSAVGSLTMYIPTTVQTWTNSSLASGGNIFCASTTPTGGANGWMGANLMQNNINGHAAVRTSNQDTSGMTLTGSASVLNCVHNTGIFEFICVARCNQALSGSSTQEPQLLACTAESGVNGAAFGFYQGLWVNFAVINNSGSGSITVWNGYAGPAYTAGVLAIYGAYGDGTHVWSYINNGNTTQFSITTGNLGSNWGSPNSVRDWQVGFDASLGQPIDYPMDVACMYFGTAKLSTVARTQFINQLNRMYHIF